MKITFRFGLSVLLLSVLLPGLLAPSLLWAQAPRAQDPLPIARLSGPITVDGTSEESAWGAVEPLSLTAHSPTFGGPPSEPTEVRIAHDGEFLYVAARLYDSEPSRIQGLSLGRDDMSLASDVFMVSLDTFHDRENGVSFSTTPAGIRVDVEVLNDAQGSSPLNPDWNTFWDVAVTQNGQGWFAEFRIPFSSLRFQEEEGQVEMGLSFWRWIARKQESSTFPATPPNWGFLSVLKPSQAQTAVLEGVQSKRPLYVTPYGLAGGSQAFGLNKAGSAYDRIDTPSYDMGLDVKYGLTDNLTLDVTVNTDFAQVEADNMQVNLSRFSLFFPEKRLFFQERSSAFDFSLGGRNRLFHSRRIGLVQGEPVRLLGGARVVGRAGRWDIGALNMQTGSSPLHSSENFGVLRLRRQVLNENSHVGGIVTSRAEMDGTSNLAYGLDANLRLFDQDYLTLNWAQTFDRDTDASSELDRGFMRARWERRGTEGFGYAFDLSRTGSAFDPGLGFLRRSDYTRFGDRLYYGWRPGEGARILQHTLALHGNVYRRNVDGSLESAAVGPGWEIETKRGHVFAFGSQSAYEDVEATFPLGSEVTIPEGSYWFHGGRVAYAMPAGSALRAQVRVQAGSFYDGVRTSLSLSPHWNASQYFELGGTYRLDRLYFEKRNQQMTAHVVRLRAQVMTSPRLSMASFVQFNSAANAVSTNLRFRYNPREGRDLYVVYNHGIHTNRGRLEPYLPFTDSRTLLVKYSHTLNFGF